MDDASLIGSTFAGRYRILELVGDGGMGQVFRAEHLSTGQTVALKLLHPEFSGVDEAVRRFEREAKLTTELSHPNIVKMVEFGESNARLFLVMEFLPGRSLAQVIEHEHDAGVAERMSLKRALTIMRPILDALEYAHERGVVHRDLKPENIMVIPGRGLLSRESIKLLDFGVAKLGVETEAKGQKLTQVGIILGTPGYMPPEQALGQKADARSDLYSCGVILYEMLTGHRPFEADSALEVIAMQLNATPKSLRTTAWATLIPAAVDRVVLRCLAKQPDARFASARELRAALETAAHARDEGAGAATADTVAVAVGAPRPLPRGGRLAIIVGAMALLIADHWSPAARSTAAQTTRLDAKDSASATRPLARHDEPRTTRGHNRPSHRASPKIRRQ